MKRLLAYLFIVLGLGLTFSVNADAKTIICIEIDPYFENKNKPILIYKKKGLLKQLRCDGIIKKSRLFIIDKKSPLFKILKKENRGRYSIKEFKKISSNNYSLFSDLLDIPKILAKAKNNNKPSICAGNNNYRYVYNTREVINCQNASNFNVIHYDHSMYDWYNSKMTTNKIIAKAEPSQTQKKKVRKRIELQLYFCDIGSHNAFLKNYNNGNCEYGKKISYQKFLETSLVGGDAFDLFYIQSEKPKHQILILLSCDGLYPNKEDMCNRITYQGGKFYSWGVFDVSDQTQIVDKDANELENERKKIAEEKRKIEEEKRKIAEAKKKQEEEEQKRKEANAKLYVIGSGTGFFVSSEGHVVSNDHVVGICRKVATKIEGEINYFNVLNTDEVNDLGLIKGDYKSKNFLNIKSGGAEFGEDIVAFGYPLSDALSTSVKLTRGIVSSLSGPGNNYSEIQIDAAIQPGNSGGPVLNMEGQVVGVASSGLNKLYMLESSEYIPENVNFAVAETTLSNFLKANGVNVNNASLNISNTKELAKIGRPATLQLFCMNTKAAHAELKKKKKHSDVLLEKVIELR